VAASLFSPARFFGNVPEERVESPGFPVGPASVGKLVPTAVHSPPLREAFRLSSAEMVGSCAFFPRMAAARYGAVSIKVEDLFLNLENTLLDLNG